MSKKSGGVLERIAELRARREALESQSLERQLAAVDAEIGAVEAAEAVAAEAERQARLVPARERLAAAELDVVGAVRELAARLGGSAHVLTQVLAGEVA